MYLLKQSTGVTVMLFLGGTGLGPAASISKNGGSFGASTNAPAELSNGWYSLLLDAGETDTPGPLAIHTSAGTVADFLFQVAAEVDANLVRQLGSAVPALIAGLPPVGVSAVANGAIVGASLDTTVIARLFSTIALTEAYAADGAAPTVGQLLFMIWSALSEFAISGGTLSCKKLDGSTQSMAFTLAPAGNPTSRARTA